MRRTQLGGNPGDLGNGVRRVQGNVVIRTCPTLKFASSAGPFGLLRRFPWISRYRRPNRPAKPGLIAQTSMMRRRPLSRTHWLLRRRSGSASRRRRARCRGALSPAAREARSALANDSVVTFGQVRMKSCAGKIDHRRVDAVDEHMSALRHIEPPDQFGERAVARS